MKGLMRCVMLGLGGSGMIRETAESMGVWRLEQDMR